MENQSGSFFDRISSELGMSIGDLFQLSVKSPRCYKEYSIRKNNGKLRKIAQPSSEVKVVQRFIFKRELQWLPVHVAATAYKKNVGLIDNAMPHVNGVCMIKLDFSSFFNRIIPSDFIKTIRRARGGYAAREYSDFELKVIINLLFWRPKGEGLCLSVGAPSSPFISNAIMYEFDVAVAAKAESLDCKYTRYADDITISGADLVLLLEIKDYINFLMSKKDIVPVLSKLNDVKTKVLDVESDKSVTGVNIKDGKLSVGKARKQIVRAALYNLKEGRDLDKDFLLKAKGVFSYIKSIDVAYEGYLRTKYSDAVVDAFLVNA